jgi:YD repeat-containing protein
MTSDGARSYGYSSENLMTSVSGGWSLGYDPLMRLLQVTNGTSTTRFAYDGLNVAAEFDGGGGLLRSSLTRPERGRRYGHGK